ncbi:MAG TPA: type II secretion system protein [Candidatus Saccharimonadia bacterium]
MRRGFNQAGDTLVEVVFAIAIISITLVSAYNVANNSYRIGVQARERIEAASVAQGQAELLRAWRDQNTVNMAPNQGVVPSPAGGFKVTMSPTGVITSTACGPTCLVGPGGRYQLRVTAAEVGTVFPSTSGPDGVKYTIRVEWPRIGGTGNENTEVTLTLADRRLDRTNIECDEVEKCS